jgi:streptogramin lyase
MHAEGDRGRQWNPCTGGYGAIGVIAALAAALCSLFALTSLALAGPPTHLHNSALDLIGAAPDPGPTHPAQPFNHACGTAVDSKGDIYVAAAGNNAIDIFNSAHEYLTFIEDTHEPCGLAVNSKGELFVSEKALGNVVRYKPNAYPFSGTPTYGLAEPIDSSNNAKGISVDSRDDRLYVAEGNHIAVYKSDGSFEANVGEPTLSDASGVAAYTYAGGYRYLFVADAAGVAADKVYVFSGSSIAIANLKLRETIAGVDQDRNPETPDQSLGLGTAGAYLAVDQGNKNVENKCTSVAEQACTAGHLLVYDDAHNSVDEFEASGEFLDQFTNAAFADAQPTAMSVDRSGGANDGTIYVSAGPGAGAQVLAFGPLAAPSRAPLPELSHVLANARAVATDSYGDVYVAAGAEIHIFDPTGGELAKFEDTHTPLNDLAVDSTGKLYVLDGDENHGELTYYTPSAYPPVSGTTYAKHEPPITTLADFPPENKLNAIAVNPDNDHVFVTSYFITHELDSAAHGSKLLNSCFACEPPINLGNSRQSIAVDGASGNVYFGVAAQPIAVVNPAGTEILAKINGAGCPNGQLKANPYVTVDQSNGHVLEFDNSATAREYDASGACVAEFGNFTVVGRPYRIAIDSACSLHEPPLTEATTPTCKQFDPANGNTYVAFDDTAPETFDLTAFGPLAYGEAPLAETGIAGNVGGGNATLNGTVNPRGFELTECKFEYLTDAEYKHNIEEEDPAFAGATPEACAESLEAIGKGNAPVPVHVALSSLDPEVRYRFRLLARNKYGESEGKAWLFGRPVVMPKPALPVLYDEATLRAEVDPSGLATEYHFEYGTEEGEYDQSTPVVKLAPGDGKVAVQAALTGLAEGTEYHFRIVAENEAGEAVPESPDQTLITLQRRPPEKCANVEYRTGLSAGLPDCRAYELVTPAETNGLSPVAANPGSPGAGFNNWLVTPRGAGAGESLSYFTGGTLPGFDGNGFLDGYHARRGAEEHPAEGWTSEIFSPSYLQSVPDLLHNLSQQGVSSGQEYSFWNLQLSEGTLEEGIYLRVPDGTANLECTPEPPTELDFELVGCGDVGTDPNATSEFVSAGGSHVIFSSKEHLEGNAAPKGTEAIYDRVADASSATVISLDPNGDPFGATKNATYVASAEDGSTVVFKVDGVLYLHHAGQTTEIATAPNTFAGISEDGLHVFYAATSNGEAPATIFACDVQSGPCAGADAHAPTQIATNAIFVNVSPDGSKVFFTSEDNLYAWDGASASFIAGLDSQDFVSFGSIPQMDLGHWTTAINAGPGIGRPYSPTRSTPDGEVFVFQSHAQLTSYENEGVGEIYRYDPAAEPGERLTCPSCDPSGAPPGADDALLEDLRAGSGVDSTTQIANLTDDGTKVFFQSPDRLLPEDANSVADVYEWQAKGAGSCKRDGGCLALISSGQGNTPSFLYSMSADGHDVFFRTQEKLVGTDVPGSPSIYDAREEGGIPDPPAKAPCQGDACQGSGSTPPALPVPASTGSGDGNAEPEPPPPCAKGKHRVKGRCVAKHHKRRHRRHRANHNRGAHR